MAPGGDGVPSRGRILVGGLRGSSGKTAITLGIISALKKRGLPVGAFKKGPDYIDAAWHTVAAGGPCYCLDVYMMGEEQVSRQFKSKAPREGIAVIEGNRGLFDGYDRKGSFSTAELAKLIDAPVLLVVDATKMTRTAAALVLGCAKMDPEVKIGGVVLNRVAGERHRKTATEAVEEVTGIPVLGAAPRMNKIRAPERHLGLVTPEETPDARELVDTIGAEIEPHLDVDRIVELALSAPQGPGEEPAVAARLSGGVRIGVIRDSAFPFYYHANLEALEREGAELVWIKAVEDPELPEVDALYLGGGFPETHAGALSAAARFRESLKRAVERGLPVYAECGGAIYLGRELHYRGRRYRMAGILPVDFEFCKRPQAHGYTDWTVDRENPFYPAGSRVRGHEFHYTRPRNFDAGALETAVKVNRGVGFGAGRDGIMAANVAAFYGHVHALGCEEWARGLVRAARIHRAADKRIQAEIAADRAVC